MRYWMAMMAGIFPGMATADPCDLIPERGAMPTEVRSGRALSGPVV